MNADADDDQGDDGEPERFDPAAAFAAWKEKGARSAALAELGDNAEAIKAAHRRLSTLGVKAAPNPFVVGELDTKVFVAVELDERARDESKRRLDAYRDPKTNWLDWRKMIPQKGD